MDSVDNIGIYIIELLTTYENNIFIKMFNELVNIISFLLNTVTLGILHENILINLSLLFGLLSLVLIPSGVMYLIRYLIRYVVKSRFNYNDNIYDINFNSLKELSLTDGHIDKIMVDIDEKKENFENVKKYIEDNNIENTINCLDVDSLKKISSKKIFEITQNDDFIINKSFIKMMEKWILSSNRRLTYILSKFNAEYMSLEKGLDGEASTSSFLESYKDEYTIIDNIRLSANGNKGELDNIIITPKGIFLVEVKNYGKTGQTLVISEKGEWELKWKKAVYKKENASIQNTRHCEIVDSILKKYPKYKVNAISIIAIGNEDMKIENHSNEIVLTYKNIIPYIKRIKRPDVFTPEDIKQLEAKLISARIPLKKYPITDYKKEINLIVERVKKAEIEIDKLKEYTKSI